MHVLTPAGVAGVAVLRVPPHERDAAWAALRTPTGAPLAPRRDTPLRAVLHLDGRDVDDVLVVDTAAGLELHVHGSSAVLDALHQRFGVTPAPPRTPAEALLRDALSLAQLELALEQRAFDFAAQLAHLARLPAAERSAAVTAALARSRAALALATPQRVVLAGRQNAGKSSLFNRLLARERAITGAEPGLTRDPVREATALAGYPYELVDTAGEGPSAADVDAAAIARGRELRAGALVVWVVDAARGPRAHDAAAIADGALVVANKIDLPRAPWPQETRCDAALSAHADDLVALRTTMGELLRRHRALPPAGRVGGFAALTTEQLDALARLAP